MKHIKTQRYLLNFLGPTCQALRKCLARDDGLPQLLRGYTQRFVEAFAALPPEVKAQARKAFELFCRDMSHPSLSIERVEGYPGVWSGRISQKYRWTFHFQEDPKTGERVCVHRVIGVHEKVYRNP